MESSVHLFIFKDSIWKSDIYTPKKRLDVALENPNEFTLLFCKIRLTGDSVFPQWSS